MYTTTSIMERDWGRCHQQHLWSSGKPIQEGYEVVGNLFLIEQGQHNALCIVLLFLFIHIHPLII
jgi:hypothetical protein